MVYQLEPSLGVCDISSVQKRSQRFVNEAVHFWYESDPTSLRQMRAGSEEFHKRIDRAVEQMQATENFLSFFGTAVDASETEAKVMSAKAEMYFFTDAFSDPGPLVRLPRKRETRGKVCAFKTTAVVY